MKKIIDLVIVFGGMLLVGLLGLTLIELIMDAASLGRQLLFYLVMVVTLLALLFKLLTK